MPAIMVQQPYLFIAFMVMTALIALPDVSFGLWREIITVSERRRKMRLARERRRLEERLKRYWVIDIKN